MKLNHLPLRTSLFLILAVIVTAFCGLVYVTVHQVYRQSANDPQIQVSEYTANLLSAGKDITSMLPPEQADLSNSLATFIIIYDNDGNPTTSTAQLNGQTPDLPKGVLEFAKSQGQNRVTWQPQDGVRIAAVVTRYEGGYVLAGRSLREVEVRTMMLTRHIILAWGVMVVVVFLLTQFLIPKRAD